MPSDRLLTAFEQLALIVGTPRALYPNDARFGDYLKDETYLTGAAELVLQPQSQKEVVAILQEVKALREKIPHEKKHLSLTLRGGGSGLSGAAVPSSGIVLDLSHLKKIFEIDEKNLIIHAECGIILAELNQALADTSFYYAVDPSSSALCTLGGSIATNAAGPSSLKYGTTRQQLASLHFLHTTGAIVQAGSIPNKTSMGFSLPDILCGSEGRLGIILDATVRLTPRAETTTLILAPFTSESDAIDFVFTLKQSGIRAKCIEFIDAYSLAVADFHSQSGALLMIELDGFEKQVALEVERLIELAPTLHFVAAQSEKDRARLWTKRKSITGALKQRFAFKLGEDIAVPLSYLTHIATFARSKAHARGVEVAIWGHAGDGNLHVNYLIEKKDTLPTLTILMQELAYEVARVGGAISGEHGLGRLKRHLARATLPPSYFAMQDIIKEAFDPQRLLNPALEEKNG